MKKWLVKAKSDGVWYPVREIFAETRKDAMEKAMDLVNDVVATAHTRFDISKVNVVRIA